MQQFGQVCIVIWIYDSFDINFGKQLLNKIFKGELLVLVSLTLLPLKSSLKYAFAYKISMKLSG